MKGERREEVENGEMEEGERGMKTRAKQTSLLVSTGDAGMRSKSMLARERANFWLFPGL